MPRTIALVTGASGFVGRWAVRSLRKRGLAVRAGVHRARDQAMFAGDGLIEAVTLDVLDRQSLLRALEGVNRVFHFAALFDPGLLSTFFCRSTRKVPGTSGNVRRPATWQPRCIAAARQYTGCWRAQFSRSRKP